jgi:hypothetical protein
MASRKKVAALDVGVGPIGLGGRVGKGGVEDLGGMGVVARRWAKETRWKARQIADFVLQGYRKWAIEAEAGAEGLRFVREKIETFVRDVRAGRKRGAA